jgi:hypothetical protein
MRLRVPPETPVLMNRNLGEFYFSGQENLC